MSQKLSAGFSGSSGVYTKLQEKLQQLGLEREQVYVVGIPYGEMVYKKTATGGKGKWLFNLVYR